VTRRLLALSWLCLAVLWGAWIRVDTARSVPGFDAGDARGVLRSDPALLYYITEEIEDASGGLPPDFRADARVQHPERTDLLAEFAVAQEFLVAWADALFGADVPLHVTALVVMALVAALFVVGVFAAVRGVTGSDLWASLAVALALVTPANYRTIGFLLVKEDLSLPLFLIHVGWLARAQRTQRPRDFLGAGLVLALALASWHAMSFVAAIELGVLYLGALWSARSPFESPPATYALVGPLLAGVLVPALRLAGWLYSPAVTLALGLWACAFACRLRPLSPARRRLVMLGVSALWFLASRPLAPAAYDHVRDVLFAKLRFLGELPADPNAMSFDARLLWQGPFETLAPGALLSWLGWPLVALVVLALATGARDARGYERFLLALALASLPVAWLFGRLAVLPGFFLPPLAALALARWRARAPALLAFGALTLAQAGAFPGFLAEPRLIWYQPAQTAAGFREQLAAILAARGELAALCDWVGANVPAEEAIAGDFVNSTALLAHTRRPIVLQPKYETDLSRRKIEAFLTAFYRGTPEDLAQLLSERFRCRWLVVDRYVLGGLSRYTAGLRADEAPAADSASSAFLADDASDVPGFELLYRSPHPGPYADYRVYRLR